MNELEPRVKLLEQRIADMLRLAQIIRINQVQMVGALADKKAWPADAIERCNAAWKELNRLDTDTEETKVAV